MGTLSPPDSPNDNDPRRPRGTLRERWRREVIRSAAITDSTRVLLLVLADDMREDGYVRIPRETLARRLDRTERRVSQRLAEAVEARLLDRVQRGQKGVTAVYRALLPDAVRVTDHSTLNGRQGDGSQHPEKVGNRHPESGFRVPPGGPTSSKRNRNVAGEREPAPSSSTSQLRNEQEKVGSTTTLVGDVEVVEGLDPAEVISIFRSLGRPA